MVDFDPPPCGVVGLYASTRTPALSAPEPLTPHEYFDVPPPRGVMVLYGSTLTPPLSGVMVLWCQFVLSEDDVIAVGGVGYETEGDFTLQGRGITERDSPAVASLLRAACLCNNAILGENISYEDSSLRRVLRAQIDTNAISKYITVLLLRTEVLLVPEDKRAAL